MSTLGSSISMPVRRISVPLPLAVAAAKARPNHFQTSNGLISRAWSWIQDPNELRITGLRRRVGAMDHRHPADDS
jgi:hypothetical protein